MLTSLKLRRIDPRRSLRVRIALIVAILTLVLSIVLSTIAGAISGQELKSTIGQNLARLSASTIAELDQVMFARWREVGFTAFQTTLLLAPDNASNLDAVRSLLKQLQGNGRYYSWIGWANPSGTILVSSNGTLEGQSVADQVWFQKAQTLKTPYIGGVQETAPSNPPSAPDNQPERFIDVATAIRTLDGQVVGVLGAYVNWHFMVDQSHNIQQQFARQNEVAGPTQPQAEVFILASDGTVLLDTSTSDVPPAGPLPKLDLPSFLNKANDQSPNYVLTNWPGEHASYLVGYAVDSGYGDYPGLGWTVLIREEADDALASVDQLRFLLLGLGVLFAAIFSGLGWFVAVRLTRPLALVAQHAREIKIDNMRDTLPEITASTDEVAVLSNTIDRLLVSLNARNTELKRLNSTLEQQVQQRTAELVASQSFNEKIVNTVFDMIYIYDVIHERTVYVSPAIANLLGYTGEELLAADRNGLFQHIHPDDRAAYEANRARTLELPDGSLLEHTYRIRHKDGRWLWIHTREAVFSRDTQGKVSQVFGVAQDVTLRKKAEDELRETAAAQERQRLARELHDSVTQTIFSASVVAQTLPLLWNQGEIVVKSNLAELARLTHGALVEMRTLLNELRPAALATADLSELLQQLADSARGRTQAECDLIIEGEGSVPPEVQLAAYRIAQEALNNVTKHARAKHIQIRLKRSPEMLEMTIADDGRGFNPEEVASDHFGLGIMNERAREAGAQIVVHSQPGVGTQVTFSWSAVGIASMPVQEGMVG